jgi:RNA recognition motif-containing protein
LYIGNLAFDASYDDLKDLFGEYGEIHDLYLPMKDGVQRGFAFVTMDTENSDVAMQAINGLEFMGRPLIVNEPMGKTEKVQNKRNKQCKYRKGAT